MVPVNARDHRTTTAEEGLSGMQLKTKDEIASLARTLAQSYELVRCNGVTYAPEHWVTGDSTPMPGPHERVWAPVSDEDLLHLGNHVSDILFASESEFRSFAYQVKQSAINARDVPPWLLMRTDDGLMVLTETGELLPADGTFLPNFIRPRLNTNEDRKAEVFKVISEWVDSEEDAHLLLYHLATCLSPGWSAGRYVLLIGDGSNGKSVLQWMLRDLFGTDNTSSVTRQDMSAKSTTCVELSGKLLNNVFDGAMDYLKDSGVEKSLVMGEPVPIKVLYESVHRSVQTNALFIEGLNKEPRSRDKGVALQRRIVRFFLPNTYPADPAFQRHMRSEEMLGAFLAVLLDHFVLENEKATKLSMSKAAQALQLEQMYINSPSLQFLEWFVQSDTSLIDKFVGSRLTPLIQSFMGWRMKAGLELYTEQDARSMLKDHFTLVRKTVRTPTGFAKDWFITAIKPGTQVFLDELVSRGDEEIEDITTVVAD